MADPATPSLWRRIDRSGLLLLAARLILAAVFIYLGANKVSDPVTFLKAVRLYDMMPSEPPYYLNLTALILPWLEIVCGFALLSGVALRAAGITVLSMLAVFTVAIFVRSLEVYHTEYRPAGLPYTQVVFDCGCGGEPPIIYKKLIENVGMIILSIVPIVSRSRRFCLESTPSQRPRH